MNLHGIVIYFMDFKKNKYNHNGIADWYKVMFIKYKVS